MRSTSALARTTLEGPRGPEPVDATEGLNVVCGGAPREQGDVSHPVRQGRRDPAPFRWRVGIAPQPVYLGTEAARLTETLRWANGRAAFRIVPEFVRRGWGVDHRPGPGAPASAFTGS